MKLTIATAALAAAGLLAGAAVYAQDADVDRSHPKAFVKDSVITTKIKSKLAADHITSVGRIRVDTDADGVVYLSGSAHSKEAVNRAVEIARDTDGVRGVHSALVSVPTPPGKSSRRRFAVTYAALATAPAREPWLRE